MYSNKLVACIKSDGKVLREKGEKVYLPFGSEYTLWFKNEHNRKVQITVTIDGTDVLHGKALLLDAGDTMDLKGFVRDIGGDDNRAFRFITKTQSISDYRGDKAEDGLVKVTYQFEEEQILFRKSITYDHYGSSDARGVWNDSYPVSKGFDSGGLTRGISFGATGQSVGGGEPVARSANMHATYSANSDPMASTTVTSTTVSDDPGITVEGSNTGQSFRQGHIGRLEFKKHSMIFQLNGLTQNEEIRKPVTVRAKKKCSTCGKLWRSGYEYCPDDGTFLRIV